MGFTQRQAAGKFTRDEAAEFIDRLEEAALDPDAPMANPPSSAADDEFVAEISSEQLAAELSRRGWTVIELAPPAIRGTPKSTLRLLPDT